MDIFQFLLRQSFRLQFDVVTGLLSELSVGIARVESPCFRSTHSSH